MSSNGKLVQGLDIPIVKLVPRTEHKANAKYDKRIEASLRAVGLIEPLIVYPLGENYEILDGVRRYHILLELGVETVPCLLANLRESFTAKRMINQHSSAQEMRMLRKSLEELDEQTIADALGMAGINHRLNAGLLKKLIEAIQDGYVQGRPIEMAGFGETTLEHATRRRFGNWPAAVAAAGLRDAYQRRRVGAGNSTSDQGAPHDP
jgi:ParB family transcriptional regulator, chromosome partitioning protein